MNLLLVALSQIQESPIIDNKEYQSSFIHWPMLLGNLNEVFGKKNHHHHYKYSIQGAAEWVWTEACEGTSSSHPIVHVHLVAPKYSSDQLELVKFELRRENPPTPKKAHRVRKWNNQEIESHTSEVRGDCFTNASSQLPQYRAYDPPTINQVWIFESEPGW